MGRKKKIPAIVKQIQKQPVNEVNYATQKSISYSQLSMYTNCPRKWSLQYKDGQTVAQLRLRATMVQLLGGNKQENNNQQAAPQSDLTPSQQEFLAGGSEVLADDLPF